MTALFSKEFSKILKIGFDYTDPRITSRVVMERMVLCQSLFFELLAIHASDKVLTLQTDKQVRDKYREIKKKAKKQEQESKADNNSEGGEENMFDNDVEEGNEEDEYEETPQDSMIYKQRKFNYLSELAIFAEYETIRKMLHLVRGEQMMFNDKALNEAVFGFFRRIVHDLNAEWIFFQMDYLHIFNQIVSNEQILANKDLKLYIDLITKIVKSFM